MMQDAMPMMEGRKNVRADGWRTGMSKHFLARAEILGDPTLMDAVLGVCKLHICVKQMPNSLIFVIHMQLIDRPAMD